MLGVCGQRLALALCIRHDDLAVIAAGHDAIAVRYRRQNTAAMNRHALLAAVRRHEQQRLLAEHERSATFQEMHGHDRRTGRDRLHAIGD